MQDEILRGYSKGKSGVTRHLLALGRKNPKLLGQPGYDYLTAAIGLLDAGYFREPTRWEVAASTFLKDNTPAVLTEFGEQERERLDREDWR